MKYVFLASHLQTSINFFFHLSDYVQKIREYILGTSRIARLDAKAELLRNELAKDATLNSNTTLLVKAQVPKRKRIGRMNMTGQPKLFGGSLEEYLEVTCEEIPLIMRSCIRVINLYGMRKYFVPLIYINLVRYVTLAEHFLLVLFW